MKKRTKLRLAFTLLIGLFILGGSNAFAGDDPKTKVVYVEDSESFYKLIDGDTPVLVDFFATWCRPCRVQDPILGEISIELDKKVIIAKVDVDKFPRISSKYEVSGIPCLIYFDNGKELWRKIGLQEKEILKAAISKSQKKK